MSGQESGKPSRSIFATILIPLCMLLILEVAIFWGTLASSGALQQLEQNNRDIMVQQIASRSDVLQNYLVGTVGNLEDLADIINAQTKELLDEGAIDLAMLDNNVIPSTPLQLRIVEPLISTLREKQASGIFVVFNTHDLTVGHDTGSYGHLPGIYIRDLDPEAAPSVRNDDLVVNAGSPEIIREFQMTSDKEWRPLFDLTTYPQTSEFDFLYQPFQTAFESENPQYASDFAYWGTAPYYGSGSGQYNMVYVIPLILDDGSVYGIVGVSLSDKYLRSLLPSQELFSNAESSYLLATIPSDASLSSGEEVSVTPVVLSNAGAVSGLEMGTPFNVRSLSSNEFEFSSNVLYYLGSKNLSLYNTNSPVEDRQWVLFGMVPDAALYRFSNHVQLMMLLATALLLLLGVLGSIIIGRSISKPVKALSDDVSQARLKEIEMPELSATGISEVDNLTSAITALSHDVASVQKLEQQRIEHERDYDLLTGIMNRRPFYREASHLLASPLTTKHAALVMFDIDNLKELNDTYGHDWGDKYIYQAARCFEEAIPKNSLVARVSGDEFFVLLYGYETREEVESAVGYLHEALSAKEVLLPDGDVTYVKASGGAAFYPEDGRDISELMKLADFTMYQVKIAGKNNIALFDINSYQEQTSIKRALDELDSLFANNSLSDYHFQPIFDSHTGEVYAYESLMRVSMDHLRCPDDVLTLARQEGRLDEVEALTWSRSFACFRQLLERNEVSADAYLFINSFANIVVPADRLDEIVHENPGIISRLVIEITEAEFMDEDATQAKREIPGFSGMFALDDYGSGYNSEVMLLDLKPKYVKVDISIVRDIDTSIDKQRIVANIVEYAHERDMLIVAEGVETSLELDTLITLGVDLLQGFFLARPARVPRGISEDALQVIQARSAADVAY